MADENNKQDKASTTEDQPTKETPKTETDDTSAGDAAAGSESVAQEAVDAAADRLNDSNTNPAGSEHGDEAAPADGGQSIAEAAAAEASEEAAEPADGDRPNRGVSMAVIVAILVALALVGVGYSAYLSDSDAEDEAAGNTASSEANDPVVNETVVEKVVPLDNAAEVKTEIDTLEAELEDLSAELDFAENELSNDSLGL